VPCTALVTGAGGFLGFHIVEQLLAQGYRVVALVHHDSAELGGLSVLSRSGGVAADGSQMKIVKADLRDRGQALEVVGGADVVFHAAGTAGICGSWKHFFATNTLATRNVVEACRRHRVGRLVFTSSPSVIFDGSDQEGLDESTPYAKRWLCHYAHSKALAEQCVLAASGVGGLLTCALRPHLIWGPRDRHLIPRLLARARAGKLRRVGDGANRIDTTYVDNAASAHLQAAEALRSGSPVAGQAYFISQGEPVNCWQWINQILAMARLPAVCRSISTSAAWRLGAICEALWSFLPTRREPPLTRFLAAQLATTHYFDITRARRDFGYEPKISTAEGMRRLAGAMSHSADSDPS
jgi:nucleoside-diphosphate-sugar epimerase